MQLGAGRLLLSIRNELKFTHGTHSPPQTVSYCVLGFQWHWWLGAGHDNKKGIQSVTKGKPLVIEEEGEKEKSFEI